jgi:hypothetical protein
MSEQLTNLVLAVAILGGALIVGQLSTLFLRLLQEKIFGLTRTKLDDQIVSSIKSPLRLAIIVFGFELALQQLNLTPADWV